MKQSNWVKAYIIDVLPCITVAIYVLAFIYYIAYFSVFNINITHYLSFVDMLLGVMETLIAFALLSLIFIWGILLLSSSYLAIIEAEESVGKKRTDYYIQIKHLYFILLRAIVKVKNHRILSPITSRFRRNAEKKRKNRIREKKRLSHINGNKKYQHWEWITYSLIYFGLSYLIYYLMTKDSPVSGLTEATIGLLAPMAVAMYVSALLGSSRTILNKLHNKIKGIDTLGVLEIIIVYYIYAVLIFYVSGVKSAEYCKQSKDVTFEIKTSDGTIFNDSSYCYIESINEKVFLMERKNENNIILTSEGIVYIKIHNKNEGRNSLIVNIRNKKDTDISAN